MKNIGHRLPVVIVAAITVLAGCSGGANGTSPTETQAERAGKLGTDNGTLSTNAEELLSKPSDNPNPETLFGVFETKGHLGPDESGEEFTFLTNDFRVRREHRKGGVAMAIECTFEVHDGGGNGEVVVQTAFATSPVEYFDWGMRIAGSEGESKSFNRRGYKATCSVDIPKIDMPYCLRDASSNISVPEGYTTCTYVTNGQLYFHPETRGAGKKTSN